MRFFLFLDDVGAEFVWARINRREVIFAERKKVVRLKPTEIRPMEIIQPADKAARAAGGFLLLGPVGAALGVLTSKGPAVRFEFSLPDGSTRQGVIEQSRYGALRQQVEKVQRYRPGDLRRTIGHACVIIFSILICTAAMGPLGLIVGPCLVMAFSTLWNRRKVGSNVNLGVVAALLVTLGGCAATPYDFPVPVLIGEEQGVSMTGYMATDDEMVVRGRLEDRMKCPNGLDIVSLKTTRADNAVGTHILHYSAIMKCKAPA